jgi:predicted MPP superfamily phosphohydrolase
VGAFFILITALSLLGHALLFRWVQRTVPWALRHSRLVGAVIVLFALGAPVTRMLSRELHSVPVAMLSLFFMIESLVVLLSALLTLLLSGVLRLGLSAVERALPKPPAADVPTPEISRRLFLDRSVGVVTYGAVGSMLGWGSIHGRHDYTVEEIVIRVPGMSPKLDGYTIAQISDLHAGLIVDEAELDRGFAFLKAFKPDLVVATGDLVDHEAGYAPMLARKLAELGARDGTVAILGNHDYYAGADRVQQAMERAGVRMLINDARHLRAGEGPGIALLGVDDFAGARMLGRGPDLDAAIRKLPPEARDAPRILLAHQPPFFDDVHGRATLQLSGHTHGGQINIAGVQSAKLVGMKYVAGRYPGSGNSTLWVNRGFGVAGPPSRVGSPPEITKIVLVSA